MVLEKTLESPLDCRVTRASRRVEEGLSRSFSGCGGKPSFPPTSAGDLRKLPRVPLRYLRGKHSAVLGVHSMKQLHLCSLEAFPGAFAQGRGIPCEAAHPLSPIIKAV